MRILHRRVFPGVGMRELSMGMSGDYKSAIKEGATMVRVGTAVLGRKTGGCGKGVETESPEPDNYHSVFLQAPIKQSILFN